MTDLQNLEARKPSRPSITCILPTRGRPDFLRRAILLLELNNPDINLIVADSSHDAEFEEDLKILQQCQLNDITVRRYSYDTGFYQKLADSINVVDTEYFYFMADDDLILKDGIAACCEALDNDPDIVSCAGDIYVHNYNRPNSYSTFLNYSLSKYPCQSDLGDDAALRVSHHLANYKATFYSIYRTSACRKAFQTIAEVGGDIRLAEIFSSCLVIASGRRLVIDTPFGIRTSHEVADHRTAMPLTKKIDNQATQSEFKRMFEATCQISKQSGGVNTRMHLAKAVMTYLSRLGAEPETIINLQNYLLKESVDFDLVTEETQIFEFMDSTVVKPSRKDQRKSSTGFNEFHELLAICEVSILGIKKGYVQEVLDDAKEVLSRSLVSGLSH